ncbi:MAG: phytoene/squalene synthase family protein, partial [Bacteroidota bacterium]
DMGRAMQMTNILRDVGEDLMRDRIYLPETLLAEFGISAHQLHAMANGDAITHEYRGCLTVFMRRADDLYHGAWSVLPVLPPSFGRATAVASEVYRAIHVDIRANGFDNLTRRAHTSTLRKVTLASTSMLRLSAMKLRLRVASAREVSHRTLRLPGRAARAVARYVTGIVSAILVPVAATAAFTSTADGHHETVTRLWEDESAVVDSSVLEQLRAIVSLDGAGPEMLERGILLADRLPESPLSAAYRAALTGMSASGSACAANRIRRVLFALEDLDRLIDRQDDLLEIRFLRLRTSQTLPFVTEDRPSVASDLSMLEKAVVSSGASLPASLMPAVSDLIASLRPSARLAFLSNR